MLYILDSFIFWRFNLSETVLNLSFLRFRLFSTKGQTSLDKSLVAKKGGNKAKASTQQRHKDIAAIEAQVYR